MFFHFVSKNNLEIEPMNLLLISAKKTKGAEKHYVWIKDISRLFYSMTSSSGKKKYQCYRCLSHFYSLDKLDRHKEDCQGIDAPPAKTILPDKDKNILEFKNYKNK